MILLRFDTNLRLVDVSGSTARPVVSGLFAAAGLLRERRRHADVRVDVEENCRVFPARQRIRDTMSRDQRSED